MDFVKIYRINNLKTVHCVNKTRSRHHGGFILGHLNLTLTFPNIFHTQKEDSYFQVKIMNFPRKEKKIRLLN